MNQQPFTEQAHDLISIAIGQCIIHSVNEVTANNVFDSAIESMIVFPNLIYSLSGAKCVHTIFKMVSNLVHVPVKEEERFDYKPWLGPRR
ncbi:MAG TPA: hypothetical protein VII94_03495 [Candidatus Saccharimonadales bacterium]